MKHVAPVAPSKKMLPLILMALCMVFAAGQAMAFNYAATATSTDLLYDLYNFVNIAATGAPAYAICLIGVISAGYCLWKQMIIPCLGVFAAVICIIKCNTILSTLGYNLF